MFTAKPLSQLNLVVFISMNAWSHINFAVDEQAVWGTTTIATIHEKGFVVRPWRNRSESTAFIRGQDGPASKERTTATFSRP